MYKGMYRGADVAIKKLKHQKMDKKQLQEFTQEAAIMVGLRHPSMSFCYFSLFVKMKYTNTKLDILLFMGVCLEPERLCIITELMTKGSLYDLLKDQNVRFSLIFFSLFFKCLFIICYVF